MEKLIRKLFEDQNVKLDVKFGDIQNQITQQGRELSEKITTLETKIKSNEKWVREQVKAMNEIQDQNLETLNRVQTKVENLERQVRTYNREVNKSKEDCKKVCTAIVDEKYNEIEQRCRQVEERCCQVENNERILELESKVDTEVARISGKIVVMEKKIKNHQREFERTNTMEEEVEMRTRTQDVCSRQNDGDISEHETDAASDSESVHERNSLKTSAGSGNSIKLSDLANLDHFNGNVEKCSPRSFLLSVEQDLQLMNISRSQYLMII